MKIERHGVRFLITAQLDKTASVNKINHDISAIQKEIRKIKINLDIDNKVLEQIRSISKELDRLSVEFNKKLSNLATPNIKKDQRVTFGIPYQEINENHVARYEQLQKRVQEIKKEAGEISKVAVKTGKDIDNITRATISYTDKLGRNIQEVYKLYDRLDKDGSLINIDDGKGNLKTLKEWVLETQTINDNLASRQKIINNLTQEFEKLAKSGFVSNEEVKKIVDSLRGDTVDNKIIENAQRRLQIIKEEAAISEKLNRELNKSLQERERALRYEHQVRNAIERRNEAERKKTQELEHQLSLYKRQAQLNAQNILRTHGTTVDREALKDYLGQVQSLSVATPNLNKHMQDLNMRFKEISGNAKEAAGALEQSGMSVSEMLRIAMVKFPVWMASATLFYQPIRTGRELVNTLIDINTQMTTLARVSGGEIEIETVLKESAEMADRLGNRLTDINEAIVGFARQGFRDQELFDLSEVATLMSNVSELSLEESMSRLTSIIKAFNYETNESIRIVDQLNEVDNNFSVTTVDLSAALEKAGGAANTFGVELHEVLGHVTAIGQVTRESGSIIGNSLKTIYSRITTMSESIELLEKAGITVRDAFTGNIRDVGDILDDLGKKWNSLNRETQQQLGLQLAGRYQLSRFLTLMQQYSEAQSAMSAALNSHNSAIRENERYLESHEAKINQMINAITESFIALGQAFADDAIVAFVTVSTDAIKTITELVETIGGIPTVLMLASPFIVLLNKNLANFVSKGFQASETIKNLVAEQNKLTQTVRDLSVSQTSLTTALNTNTTALNTNNIVKNTANTSNLTLIASTRALAVTKTLLTKAVTGLTIAFRGLMASTGLGLLLMGIGVALEKLFTSFTEARREAEEFEKTINKQVESYTDNSAEIKKLVNEYTALSKKTTLTNEEHENLLRISNRLNELMPEFTDHIDDNGQAHLRSAEAIQLEVEYLEKLRRLENQEKVKSFDDNLNEQIKKYQEIEKELEKVNKRIESLNHTQTANYLETIRGIDVEKERVKAIKDQETLLHDIKLVELEISNIIKNHTYAYLELHEISQKLVDTDKHLLNQFIEKNNKLIEQTEINYENKEIFKNLSDEIINYAENLANIRSILGEDFKIEVLVDADVDLTELTHQQLKALKEIHQEINQGGQQWDQYALKLRNVGLEKNIEIVDQLRQKYEELQEQLNLGLFEDPEGKIPIKSLERLNQLNEEGATIYTELNGQIVEFTENLKDAVPAIDLTEKSFEELTEYIANKTNPTLQDYMALATVASEDLELLTKAHKELREEGILSQDTLDKIIETYPDFIKQTGLSKDAMIQFILASKDQRINFINDQRLMTQEQIKQTKKRIAELDKEIEAMSRRTRLQIQSYENAIAELRAQMIVDPSDKNFDYGEQARIIQRIGELREAQNQLNEALKEQLAERRELNNILEQSEQITSYLDYTVNQLTHSYNENIKTKKEKNAKEKESIYIADQLKKKIEDLNRTLEKQKRITDTLVKGSEKWLESKRKEIELSKQRRQALLEEAKILEQYQKAGIVRQTGIVNIGSGSSDRVYTGQYADIINRAARTYGLDPFLIAAVIQRESGFNPRAKSPAGAQGLMQLMPATAKELGVTNPYDPEQNIMAGARYLAQQLKAFSGDIQKALAAYNAGAGNVRKYGGVPPFKETQNYVRNVLATYTSMSGGTLSATGSLTVNPADWVTGDIEGVNPEVLRRLALAAMTEGKKIHITSGFRTSEQQRSLLNKYGSSRAAQVGQSSHEHAIAVDISGWAKNKPSSWWEQFGLYKPLESGLGKTQAEPWHIEPIETKASGRGKEAFASINQKLLQSSSYDANYLQALDNQAQEILNLRDQAHQELMNIWKLQEEYFLGIIERHERSIEWLERRIEEQRLIAESFPVGSKEHQKALNQIEYYTNAIDKQLNQIEYYSDRFSRSSTLSPASRQMFLEMRDDTRLRRRETKREQEEIYLERVNSKQEQLNNLIEQQARSIAHLQRQQEGLAQSSMDYYNLVEQELKHIAETNRLLTRRQEEYQKALNSGKLSPSSLKEIQMALAEVNQELAEGERLFAERRFFLEFNLGTERFEKVIGDLNYQLQLSQNAVELLDEESKDYTYELQRQIEIQREKIRLTEEEILRLKELRKTLNENTVEYETVTQKIREYTLSLHESKRAIEENVRAINHQIANILVKQQSDHLDHLRRKYDELNKSLEALLKHDEIFNIDEFRDNINEIIYELDRIEGKFLENPLFKETTDHVHRSLNNTKNHILEIAEAVKRMAESSSNSQSTLEKMIRDQAKYADKLREEIKLIDEQIRKRQLEFRKIEDSLQNQIALKEEQLRKLDEEYNKQDRNRRLQELLDEIERVRNDRRFEYIDKHGNLILTYDKSRVAELEKERDALLEQYNREDIKRARQKEIDELRNKLEKTREIHQAEINQLNLHRNALNTLYNALVVNTQEKLNLLKELQNQHLEDTRRNWEQIIEAVREGKMTHSELMNSWYAEALKDMQEFRKNLEEEIRQIKELYEQMANLQAPPPPKSGGGGSSVASGAAGGATTGALIGGAVGGARGVGIGAAIGSAIGAAIGAIKGRKKHDGGIVGESNARTSKETKLLDKLLNTNANEQVILALKNELFAPEHNIKRYGMKNLSRLASTLVPNTNVQTVVHEDHFHFNNLTIKTDDAYEFFDQIKIIARSHKR